MSVEKAWEDAAYLAALTEYLIDHKDDHETDAEISSFLHSHPWLYNTLFDVLNAHSKKETP